MLESNERRLDALDRRGVLVAVDGRTVLQFLFDRTLASNTTRAFRLNWGLNVAGLLNEAEQMHALRATTCARSLIDERASA